MRNPVPRIAAIHDMSGFGRTSLTVAIPILSCMGIQVCPMPTAVLSTHTVEFTDYTLCDLTPELGGILDHWERLGLHFDGVYSGFMASPEQMDSAARCIRNCLAPGGLAVVDPVLGDNGILDPTMTPEMVEKMRWLISCADIITPNITEVALLLDEPFTPRISPEEIKGRLRRLSAMGPQTVVATSVPLLEGGGTPDKIPRSLPTNATRTAFGASIAHISPPTTPARGTRSPVCTRAAHSGRQPVHRIGSRRPVRHPRHPGHVRARLPSREGILLERILGSLFAPVSTCKCRIMDGDGCCNPVLPFED